MKMSDKRLKGVVIPTITPMKEDGSVDEQSTADFCEYLCKAGVNAIYPNGTNGESLLLSAAERDLVAEIMVGTNKGRMTSFIQCGSMTTGETLLHVKHSEKIGADGVGVMTPAFFTMDDEALYQYYAKMARSVSDGYPIYVYNIPGCTTNDVSPQLLNRLLRDFPNIVGIKYSRSDLMRVEDYLNQCERQPELLIGCDSLFYQCLITGGVGTVSGPGSVYCERFTRLYRQFLSGDVEGAVITQRQIVTADRKLRGIPEIPALKAMLKMRGVIKTDVCREPLRRLTANEYATVERVLQEYLDEEKISL